ncbi:hypothetical protein FDP41_004288 [Naegleria fowleri]|uniref:Uncharacterized protein n=1 Tax=Naegleria fowleri TaxID=5763 RepID=A0A6A5BGK0_NAEFO|nr:uncharacterized protein FDP41_004288 [Naegleria fowleri]KAF0976993.1 hypothetical protein FDP41_004288 [Naegleria fowleri]CAG4716272.1 unnamed protein product [Naegleria fowleri]
MKLFKGRNLPFAMNIENIRVFDNQENDEFSDMGDVKISYNLNCILVSRCNQSRIDIFDLQTKAFKYFLLTPTSTPRFMCIEENYENDTSLIFDCQESVFKCNLKLCIEGAAAASNLDLVQHGKIWESHYCAWPQGIAIFRSSVFVCDILRNRVVELNISNGQFISEFTVDRAFSIAFASIPSYSALYCTDETKKYMIVTKIEKASSIQIFSQCKDDQGVCSWTSVKRLEMDSVKNPSGIVCDNKHIIVSECDYRKIQAFSLETFEFICSFDLGDIHTNSYPHGICLNESTGELFVCGADCGFDYCEVF